MGLTKYLEGTENEFVVEYSDNTFRYNNGKTDLTSSDFANNTLTAFELPNVNQMFTPYTDIKFTGGADSSNPISLSGRTSYNIDNTGADSIFFSNSIACFGSSTDVKTITKVTDLQRLLWKPNISKSKLSYDGKEDYYQINTASNQTYGSMYILDKETKTQKLTTTTINPLWLSPFDNTKAIFNPNAQTTQSWIIYVTYKDDNTGKRKSQYIYSGDYTSENNPVFYPTMTPMTVGRTDGNNIHKTAVTADGNYVISYDGYLHPSNPNTSDGMTIKCLIHTETELLYQIATFGFMFEYNNKIYKPIVEGGYVTGYTDDMSKTSEWDNWHSINDHNTPSTPPRHKTDTDGIDDMKLGFTGYENGFVNYYICTSGNIANLVGEMSSQTDYPNLMGNIVSLKSYACTLNGMYTGNLTPIKVGQFQSTVSATKITTTTYSKQIAKFTIKGAHGDIVHPHFLDFAPYTKLEVYIPFCGTVPLPPECMYNTVTVHIVTDITSGSCTGVVKCNGNIVAQKSGIIGTTIPLSINDSASQNNAFNQGMMNTANAGGKVVASGAVGSVNAGGIVSALGSAFNATQTMNDNYTRVIGTQGDKSAYAMPKNCYLKRYRTIDLSDSEYTATIGRPVCKRKSLSSGDGFTVCDNPQVYGSMTLAEKNEIEQFMRNGIIL